MSDEGLGLKETEDDDRGEIGEEILRASRPRVRVMIQKPAVTHRYETNNKSQIAFSKTIFSAILSLIPQGEN